MDFTREISVEDESNVQNVTNETPTHDVLDEHDHSGKKNISSEDSSRDDDSESDNEFRRPTPNGHKYWFPDVPVEEKLTEGDVFDNFDEAYHMYLEYAGKARFLIRKSTTKRKKGEITHKYILCGKAEKPRKTMVKDTLVQDNQNEVNHNEGAKKIQKKRSSSFTVTDCKATIRAHRLRVAFMGGYHKVSYDMIFVPFTGIDHHQKCITFGVGLLSDGKFESYTLILTAFKQAHGKGPFLAVTDQDAAFQKAIEYVFPESHHSDFENDSEFKKRFHKLIWNVHLGPKEFEQRWHTLIGMFNLADNNWLSEMFEIRDRWILAYFKDFPMCCLMKTTSHFKSSNAFIRIHSHHGNMLVQFMLCFEAAIEKQRYTQRIADNHTFESTPVMFTALPIERHACQVVISELDGSITCSCNHFGRHGYMCRHVFCVLHVNSIDRIPKRYISKRWRKDVLPGHLLEKEKLTEFLAKVNDLKKNLNDELPSETHKPNNEDVFQKFLGVTTPNKVLIKVPKGIRNKGCGTGGARLIGQGEKAKNKAKTNKKRSCMGFGHNMRTCGRNKSKGKEKVIEESEDEEAGNEDTSDHATSDTE
nr:hypothetical protein [Tanacetum cinerariifolium]